MRTRGNTYPLAYVITSQLRGVLTGFCPCWFLNPTAPYPEGVGSLGGMLGLLGLLTAVFLLVSLLILAFDAFLDRLMSRRYGSHAGGSKTPLAR